MKTDAAPERSAFCRNGYPDSPGPSPRRDDRVRAAQRLDCRVRPARLHQREPDVRASIEDGIERRGCFQMLDCPFDVAPLFKRDAQLQMRRAEPRRKRDGFAELFDRAPRVDLVIQHQPEVVIRLCMVRLKLHR